MRGWAFFRPIGLILLCCTAACGPPRSTGSPPGYTPHERSDLDWRGARALPAAAQALRDAGLQERDIEQILASAQRYGTEMADLLPAMQAVALATEAHGPVGELGPWMRARLGREGLRGEVLVRLIHAHYTAYGFENLRLPDSAPAAPPAADPQAPPAADPQASPPQSQAPDIPGADS